MINLIPPFARKTVTKEYWIRVSTAWILLLSGAILLFLALLAPSFVLVSSLDTSLQNRFADARTQQGEFKTSEKVIIEANALIAHLSKTPTSLSFSNLIYELDAVAQGEVVITQFQFSRENDEVGEIALVGNANTRTSLADFRDQLEAHELFTGVELPISNLVKDKDITFSMRVSLQEPE